MYFWMCTQNYSVAIEITSTGYKKAVVALANV
jgi:hypothetical protein